MEIDELLTTTEAAEIKGWTSRYIVKLIRAGRLDAINKGGRYLIRREDLDKIRPAERSPGRPPKKTAL
jgi:excisionase family DNA binding protein